MKVPRIVATLYAAVVGAVGGVLIWHSYPLVFARATLFEGDLPGLGISLFRFILGIVLFLAGLWGVVRAILAARGTAATE